MREIVERHILNNKKLLCNVGEQYVFYAKGKLYLGSLHSSKTRFLLALPSGIVKKFLVKFRVFERFARMEPRLAAALNEREFLLSYQGTVLRIDIDGGVVKEHQYRPTMNNPISFCRCDDKLYYGEYYGNLNHEEVSIYERLPSGQWKKRYTFPAGAVQHIHQLCYDEFRDFFWVLTGDKDHECVIWKMDKEFRKAEPVFEGKQKYRSCFIMPSEKGVAYSTDTPLEKNWVYYSEELKDGSWTEPTKVFEMPGPCIYGKKLNDGRFLMATSVEPDASLPTLQYYFTGKLGKGVQDKYSYLICGSPEQSFEKITRFKKDRLKMWLFQFGNILFPNIADDDRIVCTGQSLQGIDGKTVEIFLRKQK